MSSLCLLTHWGRVTHICVGNLTIIGSDNGLSPGRRQDIIWTNAGILSIGPLETNFSEILAEIIICSFKKMYLIVSSAKWRPFFIGLNVLRNSSYLMWMVKLVIVYWNSINMTYVNYYNFVTAQCDIHDISLFWNQIISNGWWLKYIFWWWLNGVKYFHNRENLFICMKKSSIPF